jgi:hypothetical protein
MLAIHSTALLYCTHTHTHTHLLFLLLFLLRVCLLPATAGLLLLHHSRRGRGMAGARLVPRGNGRGWGLLGDVELSLVLTANQLLDAIVILWSPEVGW